MESELRQVKAIEYRSYADAAAAVGGRRLHRKIKAEFFLPSMSSLLEQEVEDWDFSPVFVAVDLLPTV